MTTHSNYEAAPYVSNSFSFTHPLRLQTIGRLFGINAPDTKNCRVLELGCASAVNLCAMASTLPQSHFVGIDFSNTHIAQGQAMLSELGLKNVELIQLDLSAFDEKQGKFDYIIAHGLFSWVDTERQKKLLQICREHLTENGIAYVSYNTLPGWYPRRMIREMLLYHADQFRDSEMFIEQARGMITLFNRSLRNNQAPLSTFLKNSLKQIHEYPDWLLRHDLLEDVNEPIYFHQFAAMLDAAGLQYLGDSDLPKMVDVGFPEDVRQALRVIAGDIVRFEQYLDFLWNRSFRRTLICRKELKISRDLAPRQLQKCFIASALREVTPTGEHDIKRFENPIGGFLETNDPIAIHALGQLAATWPQSVPFAELFSAAADALKETITLTPETRLKGEEHLGQTLWNLAIRELVDVQAERWPFVTEVTSHPRASAFARWQARSSTEITNQRHEAMLLEPASAAIVRLLDGLSTEEAILAALPSEVKLTLEGLRDRLNELAGKALLER